MIIKNRKSNVYENIMPASYGNFAELFFKYSFNLTILIFSNFANIIFQSKHLYHFYLLLYFK